MAFSPVIGNDFVSYDDPDYLTENAIVRSGLSWVGVRWAFTTLLGGNWHPLTWISHMVDMSFFGLNAGGHHLVSLFLHASSSVILFLVLTAATGSPGRSLLAASLFAVHPLRVESVAWAAERKDVLAVFFWMLALAAHIRYARRPSAWRLVPVAVAALLALLSKPMAVGLPITLLLFDVWPLGRLRGAGPGAQGWWRRTADGGRRTAWLVLEKTPLLLASLVAAIITMIAQKSAGAMAPAGHVAAITVPNAVLSSVRYPLKMLWPADLSFYYPLQIVPLFSPAVIGALLLLLAVTATVVIIRRRNPVPAVGWVWYLATALPVIGLFMVGEQAMADRYTYVPSIGVTLMLVWAVPGRWLGRSSVKAGIAVTSAAAVVLLVILTWTQTRHWKDTVSLCSRTLKIDPGNWQAHNLIALEDFKSGRIDTAIAHMREAVRLLPSPGNLMNLGYCLDTAGRLEEAAEVYSRAAVSRPPSAAAQARLANVLRRLGR